jgi:hypothetical protein
MLIQSGSASWLAKSLHVLTHAVAGVAPKHESVYSFALR